MGARVATVALACVAALGVSAAAACSSSSSKSPAQDAGPSSDSGSAADVATTDTGSADAGSADASCNGLQAAATMIGFPAKCEECIAANCCMPSFTTCWADPGCQTVELCTGNCIEKQGMSPLTCATSCAAETDSGTVKAEADALNQCIVTMCPTPCNP